jgi:hypothetical protein
MKRMFFIAIALFTISTMVANITIPTNFDGIVLGYSTSKEVNEILLSKGLQFSTEEVDSLLPEVREATYKGEYIHEEMYFDDVVARYINDTVVQLNFIGYCDSACVDYAKSFIEKVHSKYDALESADSTLYVMKATENAEGFTPWSREDEESIVLTLQNDSMCICSYIAAKRLFGIGLYLALEKVKQTSPDYAEENKVYGVGGVKFGDSKAYVKSVMYSKSDRVLEEDAHSVLYSDVKIGGVTYDFARFYFSSDQLISVNLQSAFYSWRKEEALMKFESIKDQYGRKYSNLKELKNDDDLKGYNCGAFIDGYDYKPILISFQKLLSKGGDIMYYVQVDYYESRTDNLYDDEI